MIVISNLSKKFGNKKVLENISLSIKKGSITGIVGKNGAGKSTLFNCINGLISYSGKVLINNQSTHGKIGFLPATPMFMSKITGKEYLQLVCNASKVNYSTIEEVNFFNLPLNKYAETYSTGMKKKLALNGVLIQQKDILILDEPFNGIDIESNELIKDIIVKLKENNKTIILSSHILSSLFDICDSIYELNNNKLGKRYDKEHFQELKTVFKPSNSKVIIDTLNKSF